MGGQIIDATVVPAPKQRNTQEEKAAIKEGRIPERWKDKPAKLRDARWSVKYTKAKISMANLAYIFQRFAWLAGRTAPA